MGAKNPSKKNSTSFSATHQPDRSRVGRRPVARPEKKSVAAAAFKKMGFNPMETQISLVMMYQDMLQRKKGWTGDDITSKERENFCKEISKINDSLIPYQTAKAMPNTVESGPEPDEADYVEDRPLNPSELLATRKDMGERATKRLQDKIG
jgi:hypothetical protein